MPEQYTDEWWHIQAPPLVFPSDDFAEAMTQAIVRVHRKQLDDIGGFTVERANDAGFVSGVVDSTFLPGWIHFNLLRVLYFFSHLISIIIIHIIRYNCQL